MSSIDERIVQMRFDNREFEQNVGTTMSTLDKLKEKLTFKKSADDITNLKKSFNGLNFSDLGYSIDSLNTKFSALGIAGMAVITRLTNAAMDMGAKLAKAVTVTPVFDGFSEYENQINSTQTIIANTGRSIEDVTKALDELNQYADLTIYDFGNMTRSAGMFTAALGDQPDSLEKSTKALKGIGNWAAYAGADRQTFNRITYQLSQGAAAGAIRLMDWRSIETAAGMAGANYRKAFIEVGEAMGTLEKGSVTVEGFRDSLKDGWLTADVFFKTMERFADDPAMTAAATQVKTFTQLIDTVKEALGTGWATTFRYIIGNFEEAKQLWSGVKDELESIINPISEARNEMFKFWHDNGGRDAMIQAVSSMWRVLKEVVSGIKSIGHDILGDLFPPMTGQRLIDITVAIRDFFTPFKVNRSFVNAAKATVEAFFNVIKVGAEGIMQFGRFLGALWTAAKPGRFIFNKTAESIGQIVTLISGLVSNIGNAFENSGGLQALANGFANIFTGIMTAIKPAVDYIYSVFQRLYYSDFVQNVAQRLTGIAKAFEGLTAAIDFGAVGAFLVTVLSGLFNVLEFIGGILTPIIDGIISFAQGIFNVSDNVNAAYAGVKSFSDILENLKTNVLNWFETHSPAGMFEDISAALDTLDGVLQPVKDRIDAIKRSFENGTWYEDIKKGLGWIVDKLNDLKEALKDRAIQNFTAIWSAVGWVFHKIGEGIAYGFKLLKTAFGYLASGNVLGVVKSLLGIYALFNISRITASFSGIMNAIKNQVARPLSTLANDLSRAFGKISKNFVKNVLSPFEPFFRKQKAEALKAFAIAVGVLALSLALLTVLDFNKMQDSLIILASLMGMLVAFEKAMSSFNSSLKAGKKGIQLNLGNSMMQNAAGILLMSVALKMLTGIPFEQLASGLAGIAVLLMEMYLFMDAANKTKAGAKGLISLALAVNLLVIPIKSLAKMDFDKLMTGLAGLGGVLLGLYLFMHGTSGMQKMGIGSALAIVLVATAVGMLSGSVQKLGSMDFASMISGLSGLALVLLGLYGFLALTSGMQTMGVGSAIALILMANAVKILGGVVNTLGSMDFNNMISGLAGLLGILASLYFFIDIISKKSQLSLIGAAALVVLAAAVSMLGNVVKNLGGMGIEQVIVGLVGLAGAMAVLVGGALLLNGVSPLILVASAAMVVMAAAVTLLTIPMLIFAEMPFEKMMNGIAGVASAIMIFGVAGAILGDSAVSMALAGAAMLIMAAAVWVLVPPILALAAMPWQNLFSAIVAIAGAFIALGASAAILSAMSTFTFTAAASLLALAGAAAAAGGSLILIGVGLKVLAGGIRSISDLILAILDNILSCIPIIGDDIHNTITQHRKQLKEDFATEESQQIGVEYAEGLGEGMKQGLDSVADAGKDMSDKATESLGDGIDTSKEAGGKMANAVSEGYNSAAPSMESSVGKTNDEFLSNMRQKFIEEGRGTGRDFDAMMAGSINENAGVVKKSGDGLSDLLSGVDMSLPADSLGSNFTNELSKYGIDVEDTIGNWGTGAQNGFGDMTKYFTKGGELNVEAFTDALNDGERGAERAGGDLADSSVEGLEDYEDEAYDAGQNFGYGFADGTTSTSRYVESAASNLARKALNAMKTELNEASPSKETRKYGKFGGLGLGLGFKDTTTYVKTQAANLAGKGLYAVQSTMERLRDSLNFDPNVDPTISPVMDLSQIQNGMNTIGSMFGSQQFAVAGAFGLDPYAVAAIKNVSSASDRAPSSNRDVVNAIDILKNEITTLKGAMESMKFEADGKTIGKIAYKEVDRNLGNTYVRNRREGRG